MVPPPLAKVKSLALSAVLALAMNKSNPRQDAVSRWARALVERRGYWKAVVAIAAKNARLAWAVLRYGEDFRLKAASA